MKLIVRLHLRFKTGVNATLNAYDKQGEVVLELLNYEGKRGEVAVLGNEILWPAFWEEDTKGPDGYRATVEQIGDILCEEKQACWIDVQGMHLHPDYHIDKRRSTPFAGSW